MASEEAGCSRAAKDALLGAGWDDKARTLEVSGRSLRVRRNGSVEGWEARQQEVRELTRRGVVPMEKDFEEDREVNMPYLMGQVTAVIGEVKPAGKIVEEMVREAVKMLKKLGRGM